MFGLFSLKMAFYFERAVPTLVVNNGKEAMVN
jgi:hypothetical protein